MILVDTGVWIDHLHNGEPHLVELLESNQVLRHPLVRGELALGSLGNRVRFLDLLDGLPAATEATHADVMGLVESARLWGRGLGVVDAHLLSSVLITEGASLWTKDKRLGKAARELGAA